MKRRNFFQTLAASVAALVLPKAREAEAGLPGEAEVPVINTKSNGDMQPSSTGVGETIRGHPPEYYLPHTAITMKSAYYIASDAPVSLINETEVCVSTRLTPDVFGVVNFCKEAPNGDGYIVDVIVRGY